MQVLTRLLPVGNVGRPGIKTGAKTSITVHNTASPGATALDEEHFFRAVNRRKASAHEFVDGARVVVLIPANEVAYHCGSYIGNRSSYGVEVCEVAGAETLAVQRIANLCHAFGLDPHKPGVIKQHHDWALWKNCPRLIRPHWSQFVARVQSAFDGPRTLLYAEITRTTSGRATPSWLSRIVIAKLPTGSRYRLITQDAAGWAKVAYAAGKTCWVQPGRWKKVRQ